MEHRRRRSQRLNGKHFVFGNGADSGSAEQPARASGKRPVIKNLFMNSFTIFLADLLFFLYFYL